MTVVVREWGHGLGVRIPKRLADELGIRAGTTVQISRRVGRVEITPVGMTYSLKALLKGIRPSNLHRETDTGPAPEGETL